MTERLGVTWGEDTDFLRTTTKHTVRGPAIGTRSLQARFGLGRAKGAQVRTIRDRQGVGRPVVCLDGRVRVRLPSIRSRALVGAASINGDFVAWRVAEQGQPGRVFVGRVAGGAPRELRRTTTVRGSRGNLVDGNFTVTQNGTVAWTITAASKKRHAAVWPRGGRTVGLPVDAENEAGESVWVFDDQHVLIGSDRVERFRAARPGACPALTGSTWKDLGGWQISDVGSLTTESGNSTQTVSWYATCDPATGQYLDLSSTNGFGNQYARGYNALETQARNGRWLLQEDVGINDRRGTVVRLVDTTTGRRRTVNGYLAVDGVAPPDAGKLALLQAAPYVPGAAAIPGATAWIDNTDSGATLWLDDADGTRPIAQAKTLAGLSLAGPTLTWVADGAPGAVAVNPRKGEPFAARPGTIGR